LLPIAEQREGPVDAALPGIGALGVGPVCGSSATPRSTERRLLLLSRVNNGLSTGHVESGVRNAGEACG
jgi:hypothetical protein